MRTTLKYKNPEIAVRLNYVISTTTLFLLQLSSKRIDHFTRRCCSRSSSRTSIDATANRCLTRFTFHLPRSQAVAEVPARKRSAWRRIWRPYRSGGRRTNIGSLVLTCTAAFAKFRQLLAPHLQLGVRIAFAYGDVTSQKRCSKPRLMRCSSISVFLSFFFSFEPNATLFK